MSTGAVLRGEQCPHCGRYHSRETVVNGIVIKEKNILLIKRGIEPGIGKWALPGGYISWDETLEEAAIREVKEETGIDTEVDFFVGSYSSPKRRDLVSQNVAHTYALLPTNYATKAQESEIEAVQWYPLDSLPESIAFDHRDMIQDYLRKEENYGK